MKGYVSRDEFDRATRRITNLSIATACVFFLLLALVVLVVAALNTQAKANRQVDADRAIVRAVTLCQQQNKITDTLVQAAIEIVSAPPNPPEDRVFIAVFSAQHQVLLDPTTCQSLKVD